MVTVAQFEPRRWTAAEVRALVKATPLQTPRYELVDGELLVTPSPSVLHQRTVGLLHIELHHYLERERVGHVLFSPSDVELEPEFLSHPDLYVMPLGEWRRALDTRVVRSLLLAVEALSPSSRRHDLVRKRPLYQRHVPEYWAVDLDAEMFTRSGEDEPETLTRTLEWHPAGAEHPFRLDLVDYFRRVFDNA